jgi:hypothetical protein
MPSNNFEVGETYRIFEGSLANLLQNIQDGRYLGKIGDNYMFENILDGEQMHFDDFGEVYTLRLNDGDFPELAVASEMSTTCIIKHYF